jgi:hypothetical protein
MRGVHDTGVVFMIPTCLFTVTLLIVIAVGAWHAVQTAASPSSTSPGTSTSAEDRGKTLSDKCAGSRILPSRLG